MNKTWLFTFLLTSVCASINAQLVLDSLGRVGIGNNTPKSLFTVGSNISSNFTSATATLNTSDKKYGTYVWNTTNSTSATYGGYFRIMNNTGYANALVGQALGRGNAGDYQCVIGMLGSAGFSDNAIGVMGRLYSYLEDPTNFAGVYGSESSGAPTFNYAGKYAGYFRGKVRVTNGIYATVLSPTTSTSSSGESGPTILSDRGESVSEKLSGVQTLQFLRYDPAEETKASRSTIEDVDIDNLSPEQLDSFAEELEDEEPERYLSPVQYGLDAEQLREVYPELVYEDANGNVSINYVEMVPLLVQSINELKAEIAELKGTSAKRANATAIEDNVADVDMVRMDQNKPNPFSEITVIALNIPKEAQTASILVYDMSGKQVQSLPVSERGVTDITVYASNLAAGMYIYTLIVDGKVAVTRRMIVEK